MPVQEKDPDSRCSTGSRRSSPVLPPIQNGRDQDGRREERRRRYGYAREDLQDDVDGEPGENEPDPDQDPDEEIGGSCGRKSDDQMVGSGDQSYLSDDEREPLGDQRDFEDYLDDLIQIDAPDSPPPQDDDDELNLSQSGSFSLSRGSSKLSMAASDVTASTPRDRFLDTTRPDRRSFMSNNVTPRKLSTALEESGERIESGESGESAPDIQAKSPALSVTDAPQPRRVSPLQPLSSGKRTPTQGPFPVKHRPHVMDLNYDPVLDAPLCRTKSGSPDSAAPSKRESPDILVINSQRSSGAVSQTHETPENDENADGNEEDLFDEVSNMGPLENHPDENTDAYFYDLHMGRRRSQLQLDGAHLRQPTLIRTGAISETPPETPERSVSSRGRGDAGVDGYHLLVVAPEIRIEKCSTGVLSSRSGVSTAGGSGQGSGQSSGHSSPAREVSISDSEEYDTDLEDDFQKTRT
jgi:hypothetical protein